MEFIDIKGASFWPDLDLWWPGGGGGRDLEPNGAGAGGALFMVVGESISIRVRFSYIIELVGYIRYKV